MSPVLEDHSNNPIIPLTLRLRTQQIQRVDAICRTVARSRNDVMEQFLLLAESAWRQEATPEQVAAYEEHLQAIRAESATPQPTKKRPAKK